MAVQLKEKQLVWFEEVGAGNVAEVGGKNANLGEMLRELKNKGIPVPDGFATTANAYRAFLKENDLEEKIQIEIEKYRKDKKRLHEAGENIRHMFADAHFPPDMAESIRTSYRELGKRYKTDRVNVAVRSSGTAEDLPDASFAGQQESYRRGSASGRLQEMLRIALYRPCDKLPRRPGVRAYEARPVRRHSENGALG